MASIEPWTKRRWRVRWRDPGGRERSRVVSTKRSAQRLLAEVIEARDLGRCWEPASARAVPALREVIMSYAEHCARIYAPSTAGQEATTLEVFARWVFTQHGDEVGADALSRGLMADWHMFMATTPKADGEQRAGETVRKQVHRIEKMWAWAADHDDFGEAIPPMKRTRLPMSVSPQTRAPTWVEMDACIREIRVAWHWRVAVVLRFTGLRVGQVMRLRADDFDLQAATLRLRSELGKSAREKRGRTMPVSDHLVDLVRGWGAAGWLIDSGRDQEGPRARVFRGRDLARAWARAGVRDEVWRQRPAHSFRKGFKSGLKRRGADDDAVEFLLGHSLGLVGVYLDPDAMPLREAVALIPPMGDDDAE